MQTRVICLIINAIIMKRDKYSFVNGLCQRNFIWNIIIAYFINIFAIHSFRCRCKSQHKLRFKIFHDPFVLFIYCMMKFIDHDVIKIIFSKKIFFQIFRPSQCGNRGKDNRFIRIFPFPKKETIIIRLSHIFKR